MVLPAFNIIPPPGALEIGIAGANAETTHSQTAARLEAGTGTGRLA